MPVSGAPFTLLALAAAATAAVGYLLLPREPPAAAPVASPDRRHDSVAIVFATAATLNANGITDVGSSAEAAEALRPLAGSFATALFALGILGTGLLAVPILAGQAAYAITEMFGVPGGLDAKPRKARLFYAVIIAATFAGASLNSIGISPIRALYWAAVVNGVLTAPLMAIMLIVCNRRAMGGLTLSPGLTVLGWFATLVMAGATILFFATLT